MAKLESNTFSASEAAFSSLDDSLITATTRNTYKKIINLLQEGASPNHKDSDGNTPLICAARNTNEKVIDLLINNGASLSINWTNNQKRTALIVAASASHLPSVQRLIKANAIADFQDERGSTALMMAAKSKQTAVLECLLSSPQCSINLQNKSGKTALHYAAKMGCLGNVALLGFQGADIDARDRWMNTPLMYATLHMHSHVVAFLIQAHCDVNARNQGGRTALHTAAQLGHNKIVALLLGAGAWPDVEDTDRTSPLLLAGRYQHPSIITQLLPLGCNLQLADPHGQSIIHYVASGGHPAEMELLLTLGVHPDSRDNINGNTPLVYAVRRNHISVVEVLLRHNCNVDVQVNSAGEEQCSLFMMALKNGFVELAQLLVDVGCRTSLTPKDMGGHNISRIILDDERALGWLLGVCHYPRSLKLLCRGCIRRQLTSNISREIENIPLPVPLKQDILLKTVIN